MNKLQRIATATLLLTAFGGTALCAQADAPARRPVKAAKAKGARSKAAAQKPQPEPTLDREELLKPYTALGETQNATRWLDEPPPPPRTFGAAEDELPVSLRFGREEVVDPLTRRELTPKPDPQAAKEDLKNLNLKGAMDKVGGKAEVQVDILKF